MLLRYQFKVGFYIFFATYALFCLNFIGHLQKKFLFLFKLNTLYKSLWYLHFQDPFTIPRAPYKLMLHTGELS